MNYARYLLAALLAAALIAGCKGDEEYAEPEAFSFVVYPGSRYLGQLTETTKNAHKVLDPSKEPPATAIYDSDAPVEKVAEYYAKQYGYPAVAADGGAAEAKPPAYYRNGEIATDVGRVRDLAKKMNLEVDMAKATGSYKAAEIAPRPNRPRVTIQRPYFDVTTSQLVDRTLILMSR